MKQTQFKTNEGAKYVLKLRKPNEQLKAWGICYPPTDKNPRIYIDPKALPRQMLSTLLEELTHAFFWDKSEKEAKKFAATVARILYFVGWRKIK